MANVQNLNPVRTKKEAKERGRMGGIASGEARRKKRDLQAIAKIVLQMPCEEGDTEDLEGLDYESQLDHNLTVGERAMLAVAKRAMKGDASALAFIRDTAGEKPVEKVEISGNVEKASAEIMEMIEAKRKAVKDGG